MWIAVSLQGTANGSEFSASSGLINTKYSTTLKDASEIAYTAEILTERRE